MFAEIQLWPLNCTSVTQHWPCITTLSPQLARRTKGACSKWSWFLGKISLLPLRKVIVRVLCMLWANGVLARNRSALFGTVIVCGLLWRLVFYCYSLSQESTHPQLSCLQYEKQRSYGWRPGNKAIVLQAYWGSFRKLSREGGGGGIYSEMHIMLWSSGGMHPHENFEV